MNDHSAEDKLASITRDMGQMYMNGVVLTESVSKHKDQLVNLEETYVELLSSIIDFKNVIKKMQKSDSELKHKVADLRSKCDIIDDLIEIISVLRKRIDLLEGSRDGESWIAGRVNKLTREVGDIKSSGKKTKYIVYNAIIGVVVLFTYVRIYYAVKH